MRHGEHTVYAERNGDRCPVCEQPVDHLLLEFGDEGYATGPRATVDYVNAATLQVVSLSEDRERLLADRDRLRAALEQAEREREEAKTRIERLHAEVERRAESAWNAYKGPRHLRPTGEGSYWEGKSDAYADVVGLLDGLRALAGGGEG